jgi:glycosyltransferase involved in cell wall biosynthesis
MAGDYPKNPDKISGGVEAVVLDLTKRLGCFPDIELSVVTLDRWGLGNRVIQNGTVRVHYLSESRLPSRLSSMANIRQIQKKILQLEPDIIHAHIAGHYAEAAAKTGLPWVLTLHGIRFLEAALWQNSLSRIYRGWFVKKEEIRSVRRATHLISISPFVQKIFRDNIQGKVYNIDNPVDEELFYLPQNNKKGQLLFVGRMIIRKGVHTLLLAFAQLQKRLPEATLRLVGGGIAAVDFSSYYDKLRQIIENFGLSDKVCFLGELDRFALFKEYSNCSAVVLSSVLETAPVVIMEAMAAGKAVVSTDAGGARYLIEHGRSGLVVPCGEIPELADALFKILSDKKMRIAMGQRAKEIAKKRFHSEVVAAKTRKVYHEMLDLM